MKLKRTDWHDIVNQIRCWDAMDLLDNLEHEMEKARSGMLHCVFELDPEAPIQLASYEFTLSPKVQTISDRLKIEFDGMHHVEKEDVNISIESGMLDVLVRHLTKDGRESLGRFMMRLPAGIDPESCDAELSKGKLTVTLKKAVKPTKRKIQIR